MPRCVRYACLLFVAGLLMDVQAARGTVTLTEVTKVMWPALGGQAHYGSSISFSGDVGIIGAAATPQAYSGPGRAYVMRFDGDDWVFEQQLLETGGSLTSQFGRPTRRY